MNRIVVLNKQQGIDAELDIHDGSVTIRTPTQRVVLAPEEFEKLIREYCRS